MNTIRLSTRFGILATSDDGGSISFAKIMSGTWRIVRCDDWQYSAQVVDHLRKIGERPGVELIDPTGLLGGSRYGYDTGRDEAAPLTPKTQRRAETRSPVEPPAPRRKRDSS